MQRTQRAVVLFLVVPYLSVILIFTCFRRWLVYRPTVADDLSVSAMGVGSETGRDVTLTTADEEQLRGWLLSGATGRLANDGNPLVIYFPGNSLNRGERIGDLREFTSRGFDVLIFDYRGYGDSSGSPSESAITADAMLVYQYAQRELKYSEDRIVVFGESLGGAVALSLWSQPAASHPLPHHLILNSTFTSMPDTVASHYPLFPFHYLLFDRWPSIERIGRVESPIIVFHGTDDEMIPVAQGRKLAEHSKHTRFIEVPAGAHNEIPTFQLRKELERIKMQMAESTNSAVAK